jgi:hypothetical protein
MAGALRRITPPLSHPDVARIGIDHGKEDADALPVSAVVLADELGCLIGHLGRM